MRLIPLSDGRFTVPGNRWDLLAEVPARPVSVAIVIPCYNQQHELDLMLAALDAQDYPADLMHVVVADDGSARPPRVDAARLPTVVVRQPDRGFRAAAARNLGAANTSADVLCFLDADTIPQPDYVRRIAALPSVCPDALVVGRRRHADLAGWTPQRLRQWWAGGTPPVELGEPRWLSQEYERSADLLRLDHRSYRYIISSVMCCSAMLFREIGGFDETFRHYGGEDWEFAHRALVGGAVLKHERSAVAWHNGPDWAGRSVTDAAEAKNTETLAVARLVPDPDLRVPGLSYDIPAVAVTIDAQPHGPGSLLATIGSFLDLDVGIWVAGPNAVELLDRLALGDPRIRAGAIPAAVLRRCRHVVAVTGRAVLTRSAATELVACCDRSDTGSVAAGSAGARITCTASWARHRADRWNQTPAASTLPATHIAELIEVDPHHPC